MQKSLIEELKIVLNQIRFDLVSGLNWKIGDRTEKVQCKEDHEDGNTNLP